MRDYIPKWHRELEIFDKIKPVLILEGNVLDQYQYPRAGSVPKGSILRLSDYLHYYFKDSGYENIIFYDSIRGFYNHCEDGYLEHFSRLIGRRTDGDCILADFKGRSLPAAGLVRDALVQGQEASVVIMDYASRYIASPESMEQAEIDGFTMLLQASLEAKDVRTAQGMKKNLVLLLVNKLNDLPAWFYLENPNVKNIVLSAPAKEEREQLIKGPNFPSFFANDIYQAEQAYYEEHPLELSKLQDHFISLTEGFTFTELNGLRRLCKNQRLAVKDMCDVIDLYKFGIKENPWKSLDYEEMKNMHADFVRRVKGQEPALERTLDVIKRAMTGMSGLQSSSHSRPKGVLFFAGPTGTGKTETAKTLAEKLFGAEDKCIRFDMSEYGQPHSDQKLLGAPPGYVGYEVGGQLTNAVRNHPFSILLFDEIEKAHPSILDKFLQILEDGRMTDGQGNTVYFSETVIIFTSNLGIYGVNEKGERCLSVTPDMEYRKVQQRVRKGIEDYFKLQLGRPELLNRIGENIVVFDFIRPDAAMEILRTQVEKISNNLCEEKKISLKLSSEAWDTLSRKALGNLENGGRGIGNMVENYLINPLSRYMFDHGIFSDAELVVERIYDGEASAGVQVSVLLE